MVRQIIVMLWVWTLRYRVDRLEERLLNIRADLFRKTGR